MKLEVMPIAFRSLNGPQRLTLLVILMLLYICHADATTRGRESDTELLAGSSAAADGTHEGATWGGGEYSWQQAATSVMPTQEVVTRTGGDLSEASAKEEEETELERNARHLYLFDSIRSMTLVDLPVQLHADAIPRRKFIPPSLRRVNPVGRSQPTAGSAGETRTDGLLNVTLLRKGTPVQRWSPPRRQDSPTDSAAADLQDELNAHWQRAVETRDHHADDWCATTTLWYSTEGMLDLKGLGNVHNQHRVAALRRKNSGKKETLVASVPTASVSKSLEQEAEGEPSGSDRPSVRELLDSQGFFGELAFVADGHANQPHRLFAQTTTADDDDTSSMQRRILSLARYHILDSAGISSWKRCRHHHNGEFVSGTMLPTTTATVAADPPSADASTDDTNANMPPPSPESAVVSGAAPPAVCVVEEYLTSLCIGVRFEEGETAARRKESSGSSTTSRSTAGRGTWIPHRGAGGAQEGWRWPAGCRCHGPTQRDVRLGVMNTSFLDTTVMSGTTNGQVDGSGFTTRLTRGRGNSSRIETAVCAQWRQVNPRQQAADGAMMPLKLAVCPLALYNAALLSAAMEHRHVPHPTSLSDEVDIAFWAIFGVIAVLFGLATVVALSYAQRW